QSPHGRESVGASAEWRQKSRAMGQAHGEDRALRLVGANVDGPAMTEDDLLHDEEPEPETVIRCRRGAVTSHEGLEQPRHRLWRNERALVVHGQLDLVAEVLERDCNRRPLAAELDGIREKIRDELQHALAVPLALHVPFYFEAEAPGGVQLLHRVDVLLAELEKVGALALDGDASSACTRVVEEIADHPLDAIGVGRDADDRAPLTFPQIRAAEQGLRADLDDPERVAGCRGSGRPSRGHEEPARPRAPSPTLPLPRARPSPAPGTGPAR